MKWTDLEIRLKNLIGISADTDIQPEEILTQLEDMVKAASTVVNANESVQALSEQVQNLTDNVAAIHEVVASHKGAIENISTRLDTQAQKNSEDITTLTKAILENRKNQSLVESLTVVTDKPVKDTESSDDTNGEIFMDTSIMLKAKQTQSWPKL